MPFQDGVDQEQCLVGVCPYGPCKEPEAGERGREQGGVLEGLSGRTGRIGQKDQFSVQGVTD